ncbi:MAG: hypothetical protein V4564_09000, partial [Pseudomonadota bacterium]
MSNYAWVEINKPEDYLELETLLDADFAPTAVIPRLQDSITAGVKGILIEYGYVDKDYRSTYYHFY